MLFSILALSTTAFAVAAVVNGHRAKRASEEAESLREWCSWLENNQETIRKDFTKKLRDVDLDREIATRRARTLEARGESPERKLSNRLDRVLATMTEGEDDGNIR